jgi:adenosine/AMP kinase
MELHVIPIEKPENMNLILGQAHFIKTVDDLHEAIATTAPHLRFGIGFCESSGPALVRHSGNDPKLVDLARRNALNLGTGHAFLIFMEGGFPVNILNTVKAVPEVCRVFCASANPVEVIVAETAQGRGILGVVDGIRSRGIETDTDIAVRRAFLKQIGYKF